MEPGFADGSKWFWFAAVLYKTIFNEQKEKCHKIFKNSEDVMMCQ